MYSSRKRMLEDLPKELTVVWTCTGDDCQGWMRDNFVFSVTPVCSQCGSKMVKGEKMLAVINNTSPIQMKL